MVTASLVLHGWIFILEKIETLFLGNHYVRMVVLWLALAILSHSPTRIDI